MMGEYGIPEDVLKANGGGSLSKEGGVKSLEDRRSDLTVAMQQNEAQREILTKQMERIDGMIRNPDRSSMTPEELNQEQQRINAEVLKLNEAHREMGQKLRSGNY